MVTTPSVDAITADPGETIDFILNEVRFTDPDTSITSLGDGESITWNIYTSPGGSAVSNGTLTAHSTVNGKWIAPVDAPDTEGEYRIKFTVTVGGKNGIAWGSLTVKDGI